MATKMTLLMLVIHLFVGHFRFESFFLFPKVHTDTHKQYVPSCAHNHHLYPKHACNVLAASTMTT